MNVRPTLATKVTLTPAIIQVLDLYELARPEDLNMSYTVADDQAKTDGQDFLSELGMKMAEGAALGAVGGAAGIVKGAALGAGYGAYQVTSERVKNWWSGSKNQIHVYNLDYLAETNFSKDNQNSSPELIDKLQALYNQCLQYQELKAKRPGFWFFGWGVGEHKEDHHVDDVKYLVNILIGRKLKAAAEAANEADRKAHLEHLYRLLNKVCASKDILFSRSDDTTYLSLRAVINTVKRDLLEIEQEDELDNAKEILNHIFHNSNNIKNKVESFSADLDERLTYLLCDMKPIDFNLYNNKSEFNAQAGNNSIIENSKYYQLINQLIYGNLDLDLDNVDELKAGFFQYSGAQLSKSAANSLKELTKEKQRLAKLLATFELLKQVKDSGGVEAFSNVINEYAEVLVQVKESQKKIVSCQMAFVNELSKIYKKSNNSRSFKDNFTQYGYKRMKACNRQIDDAVILIDRLPANVHEIAKEQSKKAIQTYKSDVERLNGRNVSNLNASISPTKFVEEICEEEQQASEFDRLMDDWVDVKVNQEGFDQLPACVMEKPGLWARLTGNILSSKDETILSLLHELEQAKWLAAGIAVDRKAIYDINSENIKIESENIEIKKINTTLSSSLREVNAENTELLKRNSNLLQDLNYYLHRDFIHSVQKEFNKFINAYILNNKKSSFSFFENHGKYGRDTAKMFKKSFDGMIDKLLNDDHEYDNRDEIQEHIKEEFIQLLKGNFSVLDGGYNSGSLKCYMLAFHDLLQDKHSIATQNVDNVEKYHKKIYSTQSSAAIESAYMGVIKRKGIKFNLNNISDKQKMKNVLSSESNSGSFTFLKY